MNVLVMCERVLEPKPWAGAVFRLDSSCCPNMLLPFMAPGGADEGGCNKAPPGKAPTLHVQESTCCGLWPMMADGRWWRPGAVSDATRAL
eukprot:6874159-Prymnesium_polylepis.1